MPRQTLKSSEAKLDPFAFPTETQGRFRILMAAALVLAASLGSYLIAVPEVHIVPTETSAEALDVLDRMLTRNTTELTREDISNVSALFRRYAPSVQYRLFRLLLAIFIMLVIFAGTAWLYCRHSARLRRRYRTKSLIPGKSAEGGRRFARPRTSHRAAKDP